MPGLLNADPSFSSRQELLDLQDYPPDGDPGVDSQSISSVGSAPRSPQSVGADGSAHSGATSFQGQLCERGHRPSEQESEQECGWGALRPRALQVFNTPHWVLFFLSVASFLQGLLINGLVNTVVTSIERRFELSSSQTGLIVSSYDIAACVCLAFASYFGGNGHKPRWLGWGMVIMGVGSLVFALPHFTTPPYHVSALQSWDMCSGNSSSLCDGPDQGALGGSAGRLSRYCLVFMLSQFLHGVGATPLYTLGVTYLDQNVQSSSAPVYIGIFYTAATVGPAVGYLLGGYFLNIFTDIHTTAEVRPDNPLWVGAWWIGFLGGGAVSLLVAVPILGYPRELPGAQEAASIRESEAHQGKDGGHGSSADPHFGKSLRDMPRCVLLLLKNPTFLFLCLAGASDANLIAAMSTFGPKILEAQFSLSASKAASIFGCLVVPAGGGGTFLGGYIVQRLNLRCRGIVRFCAACCSLSLLSAFVFFVHCPDVPMAGVTAPYHAWYHAPQADPDLGEGLWSNTTSRTTAQNSSSLDERLAAQCNSNCSCERQRFSPVCGADRVMYYSPCFAGCSSISLSSSGQVYGDCGCVAANDSAARFARAGKCGNSCRYMPLFLAVFFFCILFTFLTSIPAITATLRCVPERQKSFALGIQWILVRTLGAIPGPIIFGAMVDRSCLLWQDKCGERGSCYLYNNTDMSRFTLIAGIVYKIVATLLFLLASVVYRAPPQSPQSSCESTDPADHTDPTDPAAHATAGLSFKTPPHDGVIVNKHARDD